MTETAKAIPGYNPVDPTSQTITIKVDGNVINFYYTKRTDLSYTVNYLEQGTNLPVAPVKNASNKTLGESVTETAVDVEGYDKVSPTSATIIIKESGNVINFYYTKQVEYIYTINYYYDGVLGGSENVNTAKGNVITKSTIQSKIDSHTVYNGIEYEFSMMTPESTTIVNPTHIINVYYLTISQDIINSFTSENWANRIKGNESSLNGSTILKEGTVMVACDRTTGTFYWITPGTKELQPNYSQLQKYLTVNGVEQPGNFTINEGDIVKLKFKGEDYEYVIKVIFKNAGYVFSSDTIENGELFVVLKSSKLIRNVSETAVTSTNNNFENTMTNVVENVVENNVEDEVLENTVVENAVTEVIEEVENEVLEEENVTEEVIKEDVVNEVVEVIENEPEIIEPVIEEVIIPNTEIKESEENANV